MKKRYRTIEEFWPYYVSEHSRLLTRQLHFVGNTNLIVWLLIASFRRSFRLVMFAIASSYAFAWVGHFLIEKNRPATFDYPILSALCDMRMFGKMLNGTMSVEVEKYTIPDEKWTLEIPLN